MDNHIHLILVPHAADGLRTAHHGRELLGEYMTRQVFHTGIRAAAMVACGFLAALQSFHANAAPQWCQGRIAHALVGHDGSLQIFPEFRGDWIVLCNITSTHGTISSETCKSWQAIVLTAVATKMGTTILFLDAPACATMPTYGATPAVGHVQIHSQ